MIDPSSERQGRCSECLATHWHGTMPSDLAAAHWGMQSFYVYGDEGEVSVSGHLTAAAEITPSGVPPMPHSRSTGERAVTASSAADTSPWGISRTRAPASRIAAIPCSCR